MIRSFHCSETEKLFNGLRTRKFQAVERVALRKLIHLNRARFLRDLAQIPGDRLEALTGNRQGRHSIRVNDQYRLCFEWRDDDAFEVEIVDYH